MNERDPNPSSPVIPNVFTHNHSQYLQWGCSENRVLTSGTLDGADEVDEIKRFLVVIAYNRGC